MKRRFPILTLTTLLFASLHAEAGPSISGGGKGVVCRDGSRNVLSVETLDLWEAREIYGLRPDMNAGSLRKTVLKAFENLSASFRADEIVVTWPDGRRVKGAPVLYQDLQNHAYPFFKKSGDSSNVNIRWLRNVNLTPTNDAYDSATPANCAIEQIVAFGDTGAMTGTMLINQDLWDRLDQTNQAALIVHESYYKMLRYYNAELSSLRTRRAVGLAFSGHKFRTLSDAELPKQHYICVHKYKGGPRVPTEDGVTRVFIFGNKNPANGKTQLSLQASALGNVSVIGTPPDDSIRDGSRSEVDRFDNLSSLARPNMHYSIGLRDSVQEEMDPSLQIVKAGPRGMLKITVSAPISVFFPNGLNKIPLTCKYVSGRE